MLPSLGPSSNAAISRSTIDCWITVTPRDPLATRATVADIPHYTHTKRSSSSGLTPGQIGGIFVGSFGFVILLLLLWYYVFGRASYYLPPSPPPSPPPPPTPRRPRRPRHRPDPPDPAPEDQPLGAVTRPDGDLPVGYYEDPERGRRIKGYTRPRFRPRDDEDDDGGPIFTWPWAKKAKERTRSRSHRTQVVEPEP
jgi:hypothetical protein